MRLVGVALAWLLAAPAHAVVVDLGRVPPSGLPVADSTVLADQWRPIGILFSARTEGMDPIQPVARDWGDGRASSLFFDPDLYGAIAVFDFVLPGTATFIDVHRFSIAPYFNEGESAQLVGLDELGEEVALDELEDTPQGLIPMEIRGTFRRVEWRTEGDPGIAAFDLVFDVCELEPRAGCLSAAKASLSVNERKSGKEKLSAKLSGFSEATTPADLGDPVAGATRYDACIYDGAGQLVAGLTVARAADTCGARQKSCWKPRGSMGWSYKDPDAASDGVKKLLGVSGAAGKGQWKLQAGNHEQKEQVTLPRGVSAALEGATQARLQLVASDGACFDATLGTVKKADGLEFKATTP